MGEGKKEDEVEKAEAEEMEEGLVGLRRDQRVEGEGRLGRRGRLNDY